MNIGRCSHSLTLLQDGRVLAAGGFSKEDSTLTQLDRAEVFNKEDTIITQLGSAEIFDPTSGTWSMIGSFNEGRHRRTATPMEDGNKILAGGWMGNLTFRNSFIYNPSTEIWSLTDDLN